jgi:Mlc titration factor MtfA (ptsG expression regulator)
MIKLIISLWIIFFIYLGYLLFDYLKYKYLIKKVKTEPFPSKYRNYLQKLPHYQRLPEELKTKIEKSILLFINLKKFIGVYLEVSDEMKVVISFYACLIVINRENNCYEELEYIYVYPHTMILDSVRNNGGIYTKEKFLTSGEAIGESVIVSWDEAKKDAYHLRHQNVVIHEFTHELDFESGMVNGVPPLEKSKYNEWINVIYKDYQEFTKKIATLKNLEKYKLINPYGATNEAEFFAVVSEMFWTKPKTLKLHFPDIYKEYQKFFNFDSVQYFDF